MNGVGRFCRISLRPGNESDYKKAGELIEGYSPLIAMADNRPYYRQAEEGRSGRDRPAA